jgi:hypothetical protein
MAKPPLWTCPKCGERFVTATTYHSCGRYSYEAHFAKTEPPVRAIFDALAHAVSAIGPVRIYPQKTRIVMQTRIRFAAVMAQKRRVIFGMLVPRDVTSPRIVKREEFGSKRYVGVHVVLEDVTQIDREIKRLMRKAYKIGCQE